MLPAVGACACAAVGITSKAVARARRGISVLHDAAASSVGSIYIVTGTRAVVTRACNRAVSLRVVGALQRARVQCDLVGRERDVVDRRVRLVADERATAAVDVSDREMIGREDIEADPQPRRGTTAGW